MMVAAIHLGECELQAEPEQQNERLRSSPLLAPLLLPRLGLRPHLREIL